jgi:hypothetical protein
MHYDGSHWSNLDLGTAEDLRGVWGSSSSNVFVMGSQWIYRYDGSVWRRQEAGAKGLGGIWGLSACEVFASGAPGIRRFDGTSWSEFPAPPWGVSGLWGTSASDLFAIGGISSVVDGELVVRGKIAHYDGTAWIEMVEDAGTRLNAIWAASPSSIYVAGGLNHTRLILHYDGVDWSPVYSGGGGELRSIFGRSDSDIYAAGAGGVLHYDGTSWTQLPWDPSWEIVEDMFLTQDLTWVAATAAIGHIEDESLVGSYHWPTSTSIQALGGCSENDIFAVGMGTATQSGAPIALHYDGQDWKFMDVPGDQPLWATWCVAPNDVWAVGFNSTVVHYDGEAWEPVAMPEPAGILTAVWASSANDVLVGGQNGILFHYDGSAWVKVETGSDHWIRSISGTGPNDIHVVGDGVRLHFDGATWLKQEGQEGTRSVWAFGSDSAFAATQGRIDRFNGTAWTPVYTAPYGAKQGAGFVEYHDLWGTSPTNLWGVGSIGAVTHFDGTDFTTVVDLPHALYTMWGVSPSEVVVGGFPVVLRYKCR